MADSVVSRFGCYTNSRDVTGTSPMFAANALVTAGCIRTAAGVLALTAQWLRLSTHGVGAPIDAALLAAVALTLLPIGSIEIALGLQAKRQQSHALVVGAAAIGLVGAAPLVVSALGLVGLTLVVLLGMIDLIAMLAAIAAGRTTASLGRSGLSSTASGILLAIGAGSLGGSLVFASESLISQLIRAFPGRPLGNAGVPLVIAGLLAAFGAIEVVVGARRPTSRTLLLAGAGLTVVAGCAAWAGSARPGIEAWVSLVGGVLVAVLVFAQRDWPAPRAA